MHTCGVVYRLLSLPHFRGMNIALGVNNKQLFKDCATILEGMKVLVMCVFLLDMVHHVYMIDTCMYFVPCTLSL